MILWTIQPEEVYQSILYTGVYHCDFDKIDMKAWKPQYDWMAVQMKKRIGKAPNGVEYPVWAWYQRDGKRKKPDLRRERWRNGWKGEHFACMEIDIPDEKVLLSDYDAWSIIMLDGLITSSVEEETALEAEYNMLSADEQKKLKYRNWERVYDLTYIYNDWMVRGDTIQAAFWELRKEQIRKVWMFTAQTTRSGNQAERR